MPTGQQQGAGLTKNSQPKAAMAFAMVAGDWGLPPQDSRRRELKSSTGRSGLPTIKVIMVEATLLTDTHSRSTRQQGTIQATTRLEGRRVGWKPPCASMLKMTLSVPNHMHSVVM